VTTRIAVLRASWLLAIAMIGQVPPIVAQTGYDTATLQGTIYDPSNSAIHDATVTVSNESTGVKKVTKSGEDGVYRFPALPPGTYQLTVEAPRFREAVNEKIPLSVGATVSYDVHLAVGKFREVVEVTDLPPLIDTEQTQQANTVDTRQVENLPNMNLNFSQAIYTLPGVVSSSAPAVQDPNIGTDYLSSGFSIGGSNGRNNLFTIDGGEDDFGSGALRVQHVPLESIQEYQVNRSSFAPEFGFTVGTAINVVTKSGTNQLHGSAYGYFHDESTDAANFFNSFSPNPTSKPFEQGVIAGATLGGAVQKNKLFFFTAFERQKLDAPVVVNLLGTSEAMGLAAQTNGFDPTTGLCPGQTSTPQQVTQFCYLTQLATLGGPLAPVGQGLIASPVMNPLEDPILKRLLSLDNGVFDGNAGGAVQAPPNQNGRYNNWVTRIDYVPNTRDSLFLRFSFMRELNQVTGPGGVPRYTSNIQRLRDYTATTEWTRVLNPSAVNTVRIQLVPHDAADAAAPFPGAEINIGSLGTTGTQFAYPYFGHENRFQFDEGISFVKASHNLKFGASYRPVDYNIYEQLWFGGQYNFAEGAIPILSLFSSSPAIQAGLEAYNTALGYPAAGPSSTNLSAAESYVAGVPITLLQANGNGRWQSWAHYLGFYAQDSWKIEKKLTLNYGSRFDYDHEASPVPQSFKIDPRLGLAFNPGGNGKTVIRAGAGLFVAPQIFLVPFYLNELGTSGQHINLALETITGQPAQLVTATAIEQSLATTANPNPALNTGQLAAAGITIRPTGPNAVNGVFYTIQNNYKPQYSIQVSGSVAQQIGPSLSFEVGYNMYRGVHIEQNAEANYEIDPAITPDPFIGPFYQPRPGSTAGEPNAAVLQNNQYSSIGSSTYNGLTASLTKRYGRGLQFQANYTWSHAIDDTSDYSSLSTPFRPGLEALDRSSSDFNITHNFVANAVYTTPFHSGQAGWSGKLFADMSISPLVYVRTGVPFTLLVPGIGTNGAGSHVSEARPFHEGRNEGIGPNFYSWDMRISKSFYLIRERDLRMEFIAQATDLLNHTNFAAVNNIFPNTAVFPTDPQTGLQSGPTTSALVTTSEGAVNLLNGPYRYKGYVPTSAAELSSPLAFSAANPGRQVSFAMQLKF